MKRTSACVLAVFLGAMVLAASVGEVWAAASRGKKGRAIPPAPPVEDAATVALRSQLLEAAAPAQLTDEVIDLFRRYMIARVRGMYVPDRVPESLWTWVTAHAALRDGVLFGLQPDGDTGLQILERLDLLRQQFPEQVEAYPHLALAFAVVHGSAGKQGIRERRLRYVEHEQREIPSMADSFKDYVAHAGRMQMPLNKTPWPLLLFVADNDLPLAERQWVRDRYGVKGVVVTGQVYYSLEYDFDKLRGKPRIGDRPKTMPNLLEYGGVCAERAYFASRVFKTLGVPALYDVGDGERGGHAWVAWAGRDGKKTGLVFTARFDYDRYYTGTVHDPCSGEFILDRDVQMCVAAMLHSYQGCMEAMAGTHIYRLFEAGERGTKTGLLDGAVKRNPFCDAPWRAGADDVGAGIIPRQQGEQTYLSMLRLHGEYPDLSLQILTQIFVPRLAEAKAADRTVVAKDLGILGKAFDLYAQAQRPDLAVKLRCLQGQYLEAAGRTEDALKLYVTASEQYLTEHFGFVDLYDQAARLMRELGRTDMMLTYMRRVVHRVSPYRDNFNREYELVDPTFKHVLKMYADALEAAGEAVEAKVQRDRLASYDKKKD